MLVRVLLRLAVVLAVALAGCADAGHEDQAVLPENPCSLVRPADVAAAVEGKVTKVERVPSIDQIVAAQDRGGDAADGVGDDAYFAGGASLSVLVDGKMFSVQVQNPAGGGVQPALSKLAKRAVDRLT